MEAKQIHEMVTIQKAYYQEGHTQSLATRKHYLKKLKEVILAKEEAINEALFQDLGKSKVESYMAETGMVLSELNYMLRHMKHYAKKKYVWTPLAQFHASSYRLPCPYGVVLIMSPWNYPFMLTLDPLIDAIAAGNVACVKPSAYSPHTSRLLKEIIEEVFPAGYVSVITGGRQENQALLDEDFDYIFFTGSPTVGHEVMKKASVHLTPITLELGGKSPCIVDQTANLDLAARRIVFGKYLNAGQTCVAPDYLYVHHSIKDELLQKIKAEIKKQYPDLTSMGKIINEKHLNRIAGLINPEKLVYGGQVDVKNSKISATILDDVTWDDAVMQEEIFGPILPILTFEHLSDCLDEIRRHPEPLACYFFSKDRQAIREVEKTVPFGGGCINDTIIHLATSAMPFGGVGHSGMGQYHGKEGFITFSHYKSIVDKKLWIDLPMRYQPFDSFKEKLIRMFLK